jgi:hypothetical protein
MTSSLLREEVIQDGSLVRDSQNGDRITVQWLGTVCHCWKPREGRTLMLRPTTSSGGSHHSAIAGNWKPRGGPNLDATPNDIIRRIECYSGVKLAEAFAIPDLDREVKWHCRYARQNGIHVSPTFMIDELVQTDMSSGDPVADWVSRLLS